MRYTLILLLLSACASVPDNQTGTYSPGTDYIGPSNWGYAQGMAPATGTSCFYSAYQPFIGTAPSGAYNCATPLLFYSRSPYLPSYSALTPPGASYPWRPHSFGMGHAATATRIHAGHSRKRR